MEPKPTNTQTLIGLILFLVSTISFAESVDFRVIALFKNAAMIEHNGKQKMLRSGQTYLKNIKLISADSHSAKFLVNGKELSLGLHESKFGYNFGEIGRAHV